jgi:hypothetical protein
MAVHMKDNDSQHRQRTQAVDVVPEVEAVAGTPYS